MEQFTNWNKNNTFEKAKPWPLFIGRKTGQCSLLSLMSTSLCESLQKVGEIFFLAADSSLFVVSGR